MSQLIYEDRCEPDVEVSLSRAITDGPKQPARPRTRGQGVPVMVLCLLTVAAVALYAARLHDVELDAMTGLGLISVLPVMTLLGLGLLTLSFVGALALPRCCIWLLCAQLLLLVVMLHGITLLLESEPRFAITWVHAGFVEFIDRTGTTAPALDTRWSWPGFFGLAAFWIGSGKLAALRTILTVTPVVHNLLYLVALGLLMSALWVSWQAKWLAALLYCILNWVGQDYFSPQGSSLVLYLLFVAFLVMWFRPPPRTSEEVPKYLRPGVRLWGWLWRDAARGELLPKPAGPAERVVVLTVLVVMFAAATVCHQLTPFAMLLSVVALVLARRCELTGLPVLLVVLLLAWISYMTQAYWGGNIHEVVSGVGNVGGAMGDRASLGNADHQFVVHARMLTTVLVFLLAGVGLLRRRRRGIEDRVLLVLAAAPVGLALMQSYGGEMALRVYLFALAPLSVLAALAFFPRPASRPSVLALCVAGVSTVALLFSFFVTRFGNEAFERIPSGAVSAVETVYTQSSDRGHTKFVYVTAKPELNSTPFMPLGYRDVEKVHWMNTMAPVDPTDVAAVIQTLREQGPGSYLITTRSQEAYIAFGQGYSLDWAARFRSAVAAAPGIRVVVENRDASIYTLDWPPGTVPNRFTPSSTGLQVWSTPWTSVGVAFLVMLVGFLGVREARRVYLSPHQRRRLRPLTVATIPLLIGFVAVVIERFVLLTS
ncbi:hypothetical protein A5699_21505 [Mycobacterium sp. E802]|uniref:hypothetical protein n=1 Tax=Mycobacterium sp. E802 TaxID=1834152 RepID=UPI0007FCA6D3|nr:hypothetical protein [Mycobacterium sp. E802]OBG86494.1 hypothetical protein A5699_21505 [Mycobacterium sp. E802]